VKGRQVGLVLAALFVIGVAGLAFRLVSGTPAPATLTGLFPISEEVVNQVVIRSQGREAQLFKVGDGWRVGPYPAFGARVADLWSVVDLLGAAQTVAVSPASHARLGVDVESGTTVTFLRDGSILETIIVGKWSPQARLAYLRRPAEKIVYSLPFDIPSILVPDVDAWRDPVIVNVPAEGVASLTVIQSGEAYQLRRGDQGWALAGGDGDRPADPQAVEGMLRLLSPLVAIGFAREDEAGGLDFDDPYGAIAVSPSSGKGETRVAFLERDDNSFYAKVGGRRTVFIVGKDVVEGLLRKPEEVLQ
jgi:hypothetical protein